MFRARCTLPLENAGLAIGPCAASNRTLQAVAQGTSSPPLILTHIFERYIVSRASILLRIMARAEIFSRIKSHLSQLPNTAELVHAENSAHYRRKWWAWACRHEPVPGERRPRGRRFAQHHRK